MIVVQPQKTIQREEELTKFCVLVLINSFLLISSVGLPWFSKKYFPLDNTGVMLKKLTKKKYNEKIPKHSNIILIHVGKLGREFFLKIIIVEPKDINTAMFIS